MVIRCCIYTCMIVVLGCLAQFSVLQAHAQMAGDCSNYDFVRDPAFAGSTTSRSEDGRLVLTLRDQVELYIDKEGTSVAQVVPFNTTFLVKEDGASLVGVSPFGRRDKYWVKRTDLLCAFKPLADKSSGLERKALVKTQAAARETGNIQTVTAARNPDMNGCRNDCRQLSRFEMNFVYAESPDALLLSPELNIERGSAAATGKMIGWVRKTELVEWPWAVGLRASESLVYKDGPGTICAFRSINEARSRQGCQPILGGNEWFRSPLRLMVLNQANGFYEVVAPVSGSGGEQINPSLLRSGQDVTVVNRLNRLDVFFVIDGTKSMQRWIDTIRGTPTRPGIVQNIMESLNAKGVTLRFGFRVYRDSNASGANGLNDAEALRLSGGDCERVTDDDLRNNRDTFRQRLAAVSARDDAGDNDYSENIFGGLDQALRDMQGCPTNAKLIFMIGDAGYDASMQARRGQQPIEVSRLAQRISGLPSAALFFLRTPKDDRNNQQAYADSYDAFAQQGFEIVSQIPTQADRANEFVQTLENSPAAAATLLEKVSQATDKLANPQVVKDIELDLRGGASLVEAINRVRDLNKDVPGLFFKLLEKNVCSELGDTCTKRTFQTVTNLFVPIDDPGVQLDIWMEQFQLKNWLSLLSSVVDVDQSMKDRRENLVASLTRSLQSIIKDPPLDNSGESLGIYLRRAGKLPYAFKSPLLEYSFSELLDARATPTCEIVRLFDWMRASREALSVIERAGERLADIPFLPENMKAGYLAECQGASKHAAIIPIIDGSVKSKGLPKSFSTCSATRSSTFCWVPQEYLP